MQLLLRKNNHNWPKNVFEFTESWKIYQVRALDCRAWQVGSRSIKVGNYNAENYTNVSRQWVINCRLSLRAVSLITVASSEDAATAGAIGKKVTFLMVSPADHSSPLERVLHFVYGATSYSQCHSEEKYFYLVCIQSALFFSYIQKKNWYQINNLLFYI